MQHGVLRPFLVIEHELQRDARAIRPARVRWMAAVADEIARIGVIDHTILSASGLAHRAQTSLRCCDHRPASSAAGAAR